MSSSITESMSYTTPEICCLVRHTGMTIVPNTFWVACPGYWQTNIEAGSRVRSPNCLESLQIKKSLSFLTMIPYIYIYIYIYM